MYRARLESGCSHNVGDPALSIHLALRFHSHKLLLITTLYSEVIYSYQLMAQSADGRGGRGRITLQPLPSSRSTRQLSTLCNRFVCLLCTAAAGEAYFIQLINESLTRCSSGQLVAM